MDYRMNLSDEENELYTKLFVKCDLDGFGYVSGDTTSELFRSSGLNDDILFSVWELADKSNTGQLDFASFCLCLRLIAHVQLYGPQALRDADLLANKVPEELPVFGEPELMGYGGLNEPVNYDSDPGLYVMSKEDLEEYEHTFLQLSPDINDFLPGDDARNFYLNTTSLSQDDLMHIWSLADEDKDGRLNFKEFCVMQKLCQCLKEYGTMPRVLPEPLYEFLDHQRDPNALPMQNNLNGYQQGYEEQGYSGEPGQEQPVGPTKGEKGIRSDAYPSKHPDQTPPSPRPVHITNDLILQCENLLNTLRDAINSEKKSYSTSSKDFEGIESKLKSDTKTLENLLSEYRSLVGDTQTATRRRSLLTHKLSIVQEQIHEMRNQIQTIRVGNVALSSSIDKNNEEQALLQNTRQMFVKQLEEDNVLLKAEERELGEMSNTLLELRRQRDLLMEKNVQLRECLSQSENATKTMLRSIQLQQGKIMTARNERIKLLEEKLKLTNEINRLNNSDNNLNSNSQGNLGTGPRDNSTNSESSSFRTQLGTGNMNLDRKGIRVSSSVRVGDDFPQ